MANRNLWAQWYRGSEMTARRYNFVRGLRARCRIRLYDNALSGSQPAAKAIPRIATWIGRSTAATKPPAENSPHAMASSLAWGPRGRDRRWRSEEHTSELQSRENLVCRLLL